MALVQGAVTSAKSDTASVLFRAITVHNEAPGVGKGYFDL